MNEPRRSVTVERSPSSDPVRALDASETASRDVMRMHREGLTAVEIAEVTGRPRAEVWRALYDALAPLRPQG